MSDRVSAFVLLTLAFVVLVFSVSMAFAGEKVVTLAWEQSISSDFAGWKLYVSQTSGIVPDGNPAFIIDYGGVDQGTYTTVKSIVSPNGEEITYYFVMTAFDNEGNESDASNEIFKVIDFLSPDDPLSLRFVIVIEEGN